MSLVIFASPRPAAAELPTPPHAVFCEFDVSRTNALSPHARPPYTARPMAWIYIAIAGLLEVAWAVGLKYSDGFTRPGPTLFTIVGMILSFACLSQALRTIPIGNA